jgi:hypothetical protein
LYRCTSLGGLKRARREVSVNCLIRDLLDIIIDDKLTTAISTSRISTADRLGRFAAFGITWYAAQQWVHGPFEIGKAG